MRTSHRASRPTPKTDADREAIRLRKTIAKRGVIMPEGVTQCEFCKRPAGRDMDAEQTGELRKTSGGFWICKRHSDFKYARSIQLAGVKV